MVKVYQYVWKHNGPMSRPDATSVGFMKPLEEGGMFADLRNGRIYHVLGISKVKEPGSFNDVPKEMVQTSDAKPLSEGELLDLRKRCKFDEDQREYVILS